MKLQGYLKGSGKLGNMVVARVAGETIARDYNPNVANPNTNLQVGQRSRFKLASQVSASLARVIVIPKQGLKSARNLFVKKNFDNFIKDGDNAQVIITNLQITNGSEGCPAFQVTRAGQALTCRVVSNVDNTVDRMVYAAFKVNGEQQLQFVDSKVGEKTADNPTSEVQLNSATGQILVLAYGIKDADASAKAKYNNYAVTSGEDIAALVATRALDITGFRFTKSASCMLQAGENSGQSITVPTFLVSVTAGNGGTATVSDGGFIPQGSQCTITATPADNYSLEGIYIGGEMVAWNSPYTFTPTGNTSVEVRFAPVVNP